MGFQPPASPGGAYPPPPVLQGAQDATQGQVALAIGPVQFLSQETPQNLSFGLEQILAVHDYIGGSRVIQTMGPRAKDISWEGRWRGSSAYVDGQSRSLTKLAATGQVTTLAWLTYAFDCVVREYIPDWKHQFRSDYKITVSVLRDKSGTYAATSGSSDINSQVVSLYNSSRSSFSSLTTNYPSVPPTAQQTSLLSSIQSGMSALGQGLAAAAQAGGLASAIALGNAGVILSVLGTLIPTIQSYVGTLGNAPAQMLIDAQTLLAGVTLIQKNLLAGQAAVTIVVFGGSLYDVASKYYGNPSFAQAIAQAQTPPLLNLRLPPTATTLILPPLGTMGTT